MRDCNNLHVSCERHRRELDGGRDRVRIDWGRSREIDLDLGERDRAYLLCQPVVTFSLIRPRALLYATIWRDRYIDLQLVRIESCN